MDAASLESLSALLPRLLWALLAVATVWYFVGSYLCEVLAQKLGEPRWMAWVPLLNGYLMMRLVGWGAWFWGLLAGFALSAGAIWLPPPGPIVAAVAMIPTAIVALLMSLFYWPVLARRRGLSLGVGLLLVLPQLALVPLEWVAPEWLIGLLSIGAALVGLGAFLWIVFHDGRPEAGPHPLGWALTAVGLLVGVGVVWKLPVWLEQGDALARVAQLVTAARAEAAGAQGEAGPEEADDPAAQAVQAVTEAVRLAEVAPVEIARECPPGLREAGARPPAGLAWWCELETERGWVRHGPSRSWLHARAVGEEGEYRRGRRHGTWTRYWRTGGRRAQAEFREGAQHGWMHRWDEAGRLEERLYFREGRPDGPPEA